MFPTTKCPDQVWKNISKEIKKHQKNTFLGLRLKTFKNIVKYSVLGVSLFVLGFLGILNQKLSNTDEVVARELENTTKELDELIVAFDDNSSRIDFDEIQQ